MGVWHGVPSDSFVFCQAPAAKVINPFAPRAVTGTEIQWFLAFFAEEIEKNMHGKEKHMFDKHCFFKKELVFTI